MKKTLPGLRTVALLPLKANSERVSGKNFRLFHGKPLFRWVLDTLLTLHEIETVVINTDARETLKNAGLTETDRILIRDRKPEICGDFVSMNLVLADDVQNVQAHTYLMTHVTNPLLSSTTIRSALNTYEAQKEVGKIDSLFSVTRHQSRFYSSDGCPLNHDPQNLIRTQDLPPLYEENSNLYVFSKESFIQQGMRIGKKPFIFETPYFESVDIDDERSWKMAEWCFELLSGKK